MDASDGLYFLFTHLSPPRMRLAPLAALLALAAPLAAQTPDPTPPESYYPLGVGDIREYRTAGGAFPPFYNREFVLGDTVVHGITYRLVESIGFRNDGTMDGRRREAIRFDTALAAPVAPGGRSGEYRVAPCRLDLPFPAPDAPLVCDGATLYGFGPAETVVVGSDTLVTAVKAFGGLFGAVAYAAGLGELWSQGDASTLVTTLRFARIDGVKYGTPAPVLPPLAPEPSAYWPLEVGNTWVMRYDGAWPRYDWQVVVGMTTVSDTSYAVVEVCTRPDTQPTRCSPMNVRVDDRTGEILERVDGGEQPVMCGLLPTATEGPIACGIYGFGTWDLAIESPGVVQIAGQAVPTPSIRSISIIDATRRYAAGIGPLPRAGLADIGTLVYVRLGSTEYGTNPVAGEASPTAPTLALRASPNPTAGPLAVTLDLPTPSAVTLEAFDALGRRVHHATATLGAGATPLNLDASAWAPGVYVVRATVGDDTATVRVVRR